MLEQYGFYMILIGLIYIIIIIIIITIFLSSSLPRLGGFCAIEGGFCAIEGGSCAIEQKHMLRKQHALGYGLRASYVA